MVKYMKLHDYTLSQVFSYGFFTATLRNTYIFIRNSSKILIPKILILILIHRKILVSIVNNLLLSSPNQIYIL